MALSAIRSAIRGIRDRMHDDRRPQCLVTLSHFDEVLKSRAGGDKRAAGTHKQHAFRIIAA